MDNIGKGIGVTGLVLRAFKPNNLIRNLGSIMTVVGGSLVIINEADKAFSRKYQDNIRLPIK